MDRTHAVTDLRRREVIAGGAVLLGGVLLGDAETLPTEAAEPDVTKPYIYSRRLWGAHKPTRAATVLHKRPDRLVIHHTASANSTNYSKRHAAALSRSIQSYHMGHNHWNDIGQQFTISRGGYIMEGRNRTLPAVAAHRLVVGAQTAGQNTHTFGIENEGTYNKVEPTHALWDSLVELCAWLCHWYRLNPHRAIVGHRDYNRTDCPGDRLYKLLPKLRSDVVKKLGAREVARLTYPATTLPPRHWGQLPGPRHIYDHGPAVDGNENDAR